METCIVLLSLFMELKTFLKNVSPINVGELTVQPSSVTIFSSLIRLIE